MISELCRDHCWQLRQHDTCPVLVAYLNKYTYSRQLKALIELSEACRDDLKIYVTRDICLKVFNSAADITGTPTYVLLCNGAERDRLLGESDVLRLRNFVDPYLEQGTGQDRRRLEKDTGLAYRFSCDSGS